jgi:UDP-N-acetylmuramyl pentapeptide phosphotransferase/UDP-N-acetylglucosamine-1-phosphate transferase
MLSVINAFNLVDVMDGLATLIAFMGGLTFLVIALYLHCFSVSLLLLAFLGPLGAFFIYNKPSAKIYLGDAGSMFIGGFLAATPLLLPWSQQSLDAYYTPVVILAVPLLEVFALVIIRSWLGIPFYYGSPHHFSIYLQRKGWSKSNVLGFTGIMCLCFSLLACLFLTNNISFIALVLGCMGIVGLWFFMVFYKKESGVIHNNILCFFKRS